MKNTLGEVYKRRNNELVFIKDQKRTTVNELSKKFNVSRSTMNRDLNLFLKKNLIIKEYKSIVWIGHVNKEPEVHIEQSQPQLSTVVNNLKNNSIAFVNASPFSEVLIQKLLEKDISVVTNNIPSKRIDSSSVFYVGGQIENNGNYSFFAGDIALKNIKSFHPENAVIYASGIDDKLITTQTLEQSLIDRTMIEYSESNTIIVMKSSKNFESNFMIVKRELAEKIMFIR